MAQASNLNTIKTETNGGNEKQQSRNFDNRRGGGQRGGGRQMGGGKDVKSENRELREVPLRGGFGGGRGGNRGGGRSQANRDGSNRNNEGSFLNERLLATLSGPTFDLPSPEYKEAKFTSRCRLYIGGLAPDTSEDDIRKLFSPYGEISELFVNKEKYFAFIRLDYRSTAERAKREVDGTTFKGRTLRVRFAPLGSTIKVKNLSPYVTNELLELAFNVFGEIERAIVTVDDRGNSMREGIVEFSRKAAALSAIRYCHENCFFLTSSLKPVIVEPYENTDDIDGFSEKAIIKKSSDYFQAREVGPRFAKVGSFEHEYGTRWKQIYELYKQKEEGLRRELKLEEEKLEAQLQYARYEHETEMLREQLRKREMDRERQKREWELKERQAEEQRLAEEEVMRRQQEEMSRRMLLQEEEMRRRKLENIAPVKESPLRSGYGGVPVPNEPHRMDYGPVMEGGPVRQGDPGYDAFGGRGPERGAYDNGRMDDRRGGGDPAARWGMPPDRRQPDDYPAKRRRY